MLQLCPKSKRTFTRKLSKSDLNGEMRPLYPFLLQHEASISVWRGIVALPATNPQHAD